MIIMIRMRRHARCIRALSFRIIVLAAMLAAIVPIAPLSASANGGTPDTYWVDAVGGMDANPGTQLEPFETITHALAVADAFDTIMVGPGTYDEDNGEVFPLLPQGESLKSTMGADVTIIAGNGTNQIMIWQSLQEGDYLEGFTFRNGGTGTGGALFVSINGLTAIDTPRIEGNVFEDNINGTFSGGAVIVTSTGPSHARPVIVGNVFENNRTTTDGGALKINQYVSATIEDNIFVGNQAGNGGAISIVSTDATLTCNGNTFRDNTANYGGAVYASVVGSQPMRFQGNIFAGNGASVQGGALWLFGTTTRLEQNDAGGNSSEHDGGFAYLEHSGVTAVNNIIGGCSAVDDGDAWYLFEAALDEYNDTVADAQGSDTVAYAVSSAMNVYDSIYWNPERVSDFIGATLIDHCCISDDDVAGIAKGNTLGTGNIFDDPMIIGGPERDPRLMVGSPCIDAADEGTAADTDFFGAARPVDGDAGGTAESDMGAVEHPELVLGALQGDDRYATAAAVAASAFESASTAIIASGENFPDALSAAGLAGVYNAPLLLVRKASVPSVVNSTLTDLGVTDVIIVGGAPAVSAAVATALDVTYDVERIEGGDRYETAAKVARRIAQEEGADFSKSAFIARGDLFPDALAAAPLSFASKTPILLTSPVSLSTHTSAALADLDIESGWVIGSTSAVSESVKAAVDGVLVANGGSASGRWWGTNRYETARAVAEGGVDEGFAYWDYIGVATGQNFPDALAGGVCAGANGGVVALTSPTSLPTSTAGMLSAQGARVMRIDIYGGPSAVSTQVRDAIWSALGW
ncbi:MAG: hypothetical protein CVT59_11760 [Actinobacteria bacterium HGW-Actinobacteria-1]|nr:MAG: hypothetical protein CVT59_11760 [Actinobacteria bacterium HGW-Actinobacteria-1]